MLEDGRILLTGIQGLVRLALDQRRADQRAGLNTGTLVSGYQGSPLGGLDKELARHRGLLDAPPRHATWPGLNEELGATSVVGQPALAGSCPARNTTACSACGTARPRPRPRRRRAAPRQLRRRLAQGRRPWPWSATTPPASPPRSPARPSRCSRRCNMPCSSRATCRRSSTSACTRYACSRASGLWTGFKIVTNVADAVGTAQVAPNRVSPGPAGPRVDGKHGSTSPTATCSPRSRWRWSAPCSAFAPSSALAYARENGVNRIEGFAPTPGSGSSPPARPTTTCATRCATSASDERGLARAGVRVLKLGMIWPLEPQIVREFAEGLHEIVVVEEKGPFVESPAQGDPLRGRPRSAHRRQARRSGRARAARRLDLDADMIARAIGARLEAPRGDRLRRARTSA